jgi:hypothetical protein
MATMLSPPSQVEQRVVLRDVSWETYERLLAEQADRSNPRLTYDRGLLELRSPQGEHEHLVHTMTLAFNALARVWILIRVVMVRPLSGVRTPRAASRRTPASASTI